MAMAATTRANAASALACHSTRWRSPAPLLARPIWLRASTASDYDLSQCIGLRVNVAFRWFYAREIGLLRGFRSPRARDNFQVSTATLYRARD
jgi:hypothetical protein